MVSFREVDVGDARLVLDWRTKLRVTSQMLTDIAYDEVGQRAWLERCYDNPSYYHWIVEVAGRPIGLANISDLDVSARSVSWGYYIGEDSALGVGAWIPPYVYNWLFRVVGIETIEIDVLTANTTVLRMHQFHGYRGVQGPPKSVQKGEDILELQTMVLDASTWGRLERFQRYVADFPTRRWRAAPSLIVGARQDQRSYG